MILRLKIGSPVTNKNLRVVFKLVIIVSDCLGDRDGGKKKKPGGRPKSLRMMNLGEIAGDGGETTKDVKGEQNSPWRECCSVVSWTFPSPTTLGNTI